MPCYTPPAYSPYVEAELKCYTKQAELQAGNDMGRCNNIRKQHVFICTAQISSLKSNTLSSTVLTLGRPSPLHSTCESYNRTRERSK